VVLDDGLRRRAYRRISAREKGLETYGIDPGPPAEVGAGRSTGRPQTSRLFPKRMATKLPFADESFDAVLSSGVIEHIGEPLARQTAAPASARRLYSRSDPRVAARRASYDRGAQRGRFPIDFWHGTVGRVRLPPAARHIPYEAWMAERTEGRPVGSLSAG